MTEKEVLLKAKELGTAIGKSEEWKQFKKASKIFKENDSIQKLLKALQDKEKVQEKKLKEGKVVEVEEKHEIKRLEQEISKNDIFLSFVKSENIYLTLMEKIDKAIREGTETEEKK